jgi:hypothetical protein
LLRGGKRNLAVPSRLVPPEHRKAYQICVSRVWKQREIELYPCSLRQRMPMIRIPLRETDDDVVLDLQMFIDRCYHNGRYDDLDYRRELVPALNPDDAAWADALLKAAGYR